MSFNKKDYEFKKEYEKIIVKDLEKIGDLLTQIDKIYDNLRFYAIQTKWDDGGEAIFNTFNNFRNIGDSYQNWRDHVLYRLSQGDKILKLKESLIEKLKEG